MSLEENINKTIEHIRNLESENADLKAEFVKQANNTEMSTGYRNDELAFLEALALSVTKVIIGQKPISDLSWEIYSRTAKLLLERKILNEQALKEEQYENPKERNCGGS